MLDIRPISLIADYFVVCSATSERQINAVTRDIADKLRQGGLRPLRVEGEPASGWVLMDYGDVVVHIFDVARRDYYSLEDLWSAAVPLVRMQ